MDLTAHQLNKQFYSEIAEEGNPSLDAVVRRNRATRRKAKKYKVFYDPKFQREYASWTLKQKRKFIMSVFAGRNWGTIAVADIRLCLEHAKEVNCTDSIKYYLELLNAGYVYLSLDGQHRTKCVQEFFEGEFTINGDVKDAEGSIHHLRNKKYQNLPSALKALFQNRRFLIEKGDDILYWDLPEIFKDLNGGEALNDQETRQASHGVVAELVKKVCLSNAKFLGKQGLLLSKKEYTRAKDGETIAKLFMDLKRSYNLNSSKGFPEDPSLRTKQINDWYSLGDELQVSCINDPNSPYDASELIRAEHIINNTLGFLSHLNEHYSLEKVYMPQLWNAIWTFEEIYDSGCNLGTAHYIDLWDYILDIERDVVDASEKDYAATRNYFRSVGNMTDYDATKTSGFYHGKGGLMHQSADRLIRKNTFKEALLDDLEKFRFPALHPLLVSNGRPVPSAPAFPTPESATV